MNLVSRFLSRDDVVLDLNVPDKVRALEEAALLVESHHHLNHAPIFRALWRREQSGSTGLGHGIAIPHARIIGITDPIILLMRSKLPVKFGAPDREGVSIFFVILVPEHASEEHLQLLATVSEMFSDSRLRERLATATEPSAIHHLFEEWTTDGGSPLSR